METNQPLEARWLPFSTLSLLLPRFEPLRWRALVKIGFDGRFAVRQISSEEWWVRMLSEIRCVATQYLSWNRSFYRKTLPTYASGGGILGSSAQMCTAPRRRFTLKVHYSLNTMSCLCQLSWQRLPTQSRVVPSKIRLLDPVDLETKLTRPAFYINCIFIIVEAMSKPYML
jgi:hypothetical protein